MNNYKNSLIFVQIGLTFITKFAVITNAVIKSVHCTTNDDLKTSYFFKGKHILEGFL